MLHRIRHLGAAFGPWIRTRLKQLLVKVVEWSIPSFLLALLVGFILQSANDASSIRNDALKLANRTAYAARPIWDGQVEWSAQKRIDVHEEMDSLHFGLEGRLPDPLWQCAGRLMDWVKTAPSETITDMDRWTAAFSARRKAYADAVNRWRTRESYWFWLPWEGSISCAPD